MNLSTTNEESNIKNVELDFSTLSCQQQKSKSKMTDEFPTAVTRTCKKHWTAVLAQCDSKNMREYFSLIVLIFLQDPTFHNIFVNKVKNSHLLELYDKATQVSKSTFNPWFCWKKFCWEVVLLQCNKDVQKQLVVSFTWLSSSGINKIKSFKTSLISKPA